jgi:hypothetical protein
MTSGCPRYFYNAECEEVIKKINNAKRNDLERRWLNARYFTGEGASGSKPVACVGQLRNAML